MPEEITREINLLAPWGQRIHITDDIYTPGPLDTEYRWEFIKNFLPRKLQGMSVLDAGCNAGYFSIKMEEMGAEEVLGIDFAHYIKQANFVKRIKGANKVNFAIHSVYTLPLSRKFNLTLCLGLLYHLKYPFFALKKISELTTEMVLIETEALVDEIDTDKMKFVEHTYRNDGTTWWIPGEECLKGMLRSVGFKFVKSYPYPENHAIFGKHYSQGLTEEGIRKGRRIVVIGLKVLNPERIGILLSELPELEREINLEL
ncbi:MAG: DUF1698 domain-containing protein, partial [Caldiserica bacterium]|nr:DUF1698 domain-containing protein [Caldisericota bacterium]